MHKLMRIIVGHRTNTIFLSGTTPGEFFVDCTNQYCIRFLLQGIQNLVQTGVLD